MPLLSSVSRRFTELIKRNSQPEVEYSIVICSIDPAKFEAISNNFNDLFGAGNIQIIGIHDARSLCEAYNRGVRRAKGRFLIFCHDDIQLLTDDFSSRLTKHLESFDIVGVAGADKVVGGAWFLAGTPHNFMLVTSPMPNSDDLVTTIEGSGGLVVPGIQVLDGLFFACHRKVVETLSFDASTFDHFHGYDIDFTYRAFLKGFRLAVCRDLFIVHYSHGSFDSVWQLYRQRFEEKFNLPPPPRPSQRKTVVNVRFTKALLDDPKAVREMCAESSLMKWIAGLDSRQSPGE